MTKFYRGDAVWVMPQNAYVAPPGPPLKGSLFDDPERLQRTWDLTVDSMRADAARPQDDELNARVAAEVQAFHERFEATRAQDRTKQKPVTQLAVEAYEPPSRLMQIAGSVGAALHINRFR